MPVYNIYITPLYYIRNYVYNRQLYLLCFVKQMKFFATNGLKHLIQMPCEWLYNPIIEINAIGYVIALGNIIKTLKIPPTITVNACYYIS